MFVPYDLIMSEMDSTRICPQCAETIKVAAKVCPYCGKAKIRWYLLDAKEWLALFFIIVLIGLFCLAVKLLSAGRNFVASRDKITVLSSAVAMLAESWSTNLVVTGLMTNASDYAWADVDFDVRFLDASGKLVEAGSGADSFTVLPHSDHGFCLHLYPLKRMPDYATFLVVARSARDPDDWLGD